MKLSIVFVILALFSIAFAQRKPCIKSGCSGQICGEESMMSTCEWRPQYECYRNAKCERQADGKCGWTMTDAFKACLGQSSNFRRAI